MASGCGPHAASRGQPLLCDVGMLREGTFFFFLNCPLKTDVSQLILNLFFFFFLYSLCGRTSVLLIIGGPGDDGRKVLLRGCDEI